MGHTPNSPYARHRVVIVGGGFGGVRAAKALKRLPVDVTLIDRNNHHLFQPLLYQVATGVLSPGQVAPALRSLFRGQDNVRVLMGEVQRFDLERKIVHAVAQHELEIPYDTLIVAAGATHSYFGNDAWAADAPGMKTLDDANRVRSRILWAFELAEQAQSAEERAALLTFVVVGAGPTGVELAGQIAILARRILKKEHRAIDPTEARVLLLDAAPHVLPPFPEKLRAHAEQDLTKLGVEVELNAMAVDIDDVGIQVADTRDAGQRRRIASRTVLWAAGVQASPLARLLAQESGTSTDRAGRLLVRHDLTLPVHPEVFAIGDMVSRPGVPGVAQGAIQEGRYVAKVIASRIGQQPAPPPFRYKDKGTMATIGRTHAVAQVGGAKLTGLLAFYIWAFVHIAYLVGWGNRFEAVARWMWTIVARNRRERLISPDSLHVGDHLHDVIEAEAERERQRVSA
ncbi:NAD(P)/FAD-dependent oxidoreductase [Conexibacter sp. CPCC 206217]|uniref:NAD(P)/FAD-dependent oxidoreductase n=1 Tax=Conexibacter sp. CPCC 206217 TaxID=3064574 RepID=UPI00271A1F95|nr:NAD(P)/FAD-dependent oxidoreductase [Conexibacter sp. CPCC 206217]MDO8214177.1 NAD(P)/FAD-dependent oxidoreductase [Conexibacter sp. CPCC 206217]